MLNQLKKFIRPISHKDIDFMVTISKQRDNFFVLDEILEISKSEIEDYYLCKSNIYIVEDENKKQIGVLECIDIQKTICMYFLRFAFIDYDINKKNIKDTIVNMLHYLFSIENAWKVITQSLSREDKINSLLKDIGFTKEAELRESFYDFNKYENVYLYGFLKNNFIDRVKND